MRHQKVVLTNKNKGKITHRVRVVRNRVYSACSADGKIIFGASHAIHIGSKKKGCKACTKNECTDPTHNALRFILSDKTEYSKIRRNGLKTAIRKGERFFAEELATMSFSRSWDNKRLLLENGDTRPWESIVEYDKLTGHKFETVERLIPVQ